MNRTFKELAKRGLCITMAGVLCTGTAVLSTGEYQVKAANVKAQGYNNGMKVDYEAIVVNTGTSNRWFKYGYCQYVSETGDFVKLDLASKRFKSKKILVTYGTNIYFYDMVTTDGYTIPSFTERASAGDICIDLSDEALIQANYKTTVSFFSNYDVSNRNGMVKSCKYSYVDENGAEVTKSKEFGIPFHDTFTLSTKANTSVKVWDICLQNGQSIPTTFVYTTPQKNDGTFQIDIQDYCKTSKVIFNFNSKSGLTASGMFKYTLNGKECTKKYTDVSNSVELVCDTLSDVEIGYINVPGKGTAEFLPLTNILGGKEFDIDLDDLCYRTATPTITETPTATVAPTITPEVTETPAVVTTPAVTATPIMTAEPTEAPTIPEPGIPSGPVENNQVLSISSQKVNLKVGEKYTLTAASTNGNVIYKTSNPAIATIDKNGKITAKKAGNITITVTSGDLEKKCVVSVAKTPTAATTKLNVTKKTLKKGKSFVIKVRFSNGTSDKKITYKTSSKKIATVSKAGKITAKKAGKCKITVSTSNGIKKTVLVIVK